MILHSLPQPPPPGNEDAAAATERRWPWRPSSAGSSNAPSWGKGELRRGQPDRRREDASAALLASPRAMPLLASPSARTGEARPSLTGRKTRWRGGWGGRRALAPRHGCPNIFRKPVNSAKRLRRFVQVEEKDACGACKLRGSCDKAYLTVATEDEVEAMTVDVVRILLSYAIEPTSFSGENSVDGGVQKSARNLLSELTARSNTAIDPSCIKPISRTSSKSKESVVKAPGSVAKGRGTTETEMKKGDWLCSEC